MNASNLKSIVYELMPNQWLIRSGSKDNREIFLTFDDGPHEGYTESLLALLNDRNIKVSFFVTGDHVKKHNDLLKKIITEGHDVFNHSYSHWEFEKFTASDQIKDISKLDKLLPAISMSKLHPFRPPRGKLSIPLFVRLISTGRQIIYWSYDSMDYKQRSEEYLLKRFEHNPVKSGDIILFHDDNPFTISALPKLLDMWLSAGFNIQPISKLSSH